MTLIDKAKLLDRLDKTIEMYKEGERSAAKLNDYDLARWNEIAHHVTYAIRDRIRAGACDPEEVSP